MEISFPESETYAYVVKADSPAFELLRRSIPIRPGSILPCSQEELESFSNDIVKIPIVKSSD